MENQNKYISRKKKKIELKNMYFVGKYLFLSSSKSDPKKTNNMLCQHHLTRFVRMYNFQSYKPRQHKNIIVIYSVQTFSCD